MEAHETIAAEYLRCGAGVDIGRAISRGWALVRDNMGVLIGATALGWLITFGLAFVPVVGWAVGIVLLGGLDYMFIRRIRGETVQIGDVFAGFNLAFLHLTLAGLVKWLLTSLGFGLCILLGIEALIRARQLHRDDVDARPPLKKSRRTDFPISK